jgi:hypothetical protein
MSDPPTPGSSTARPGFRGRPKAAEIRRTLQAFGLGSLLGLILLRLPRSADPGRG